MFVLESRILTSCNAMEDKSFYNKSNNFNRGFNGVVKNSLWWNDGKKEKRSTSQPGPSWFQGRLNVVIGGFNPSAVSNIANQKRSHTMKIYKSNNPQTGKNNPNKKSVKYNGTIYPTIKEMTQNTGFSNFVINKMIRNNQVELIDGRK